MNLLGSNRFNSWDWRAHASLFKICCNLTWTLISCQPENVGQEKQVLVSTTTVWLLWCNLQKCSAFFWRFALIHKSLNLERQMGLSLFPEVLHSFHNMCLEIWMLFYLESRGERKWNACQFAVFYIFLSSAGCTNKHFEPFPPECPGMPCGLINLATPGTDWKLLFSWILFKTWLQWWGGEGTPGKGKKQKRERARKSLTANIASCFVTDREIFAILLG